MKHLAYPSAERKFSMPSLASIPEFSESSLDPQLTGILSATDVFDFGASSSENDAMQIQTNLKTQQQFVGPQPCFKNTDPFSVSKTTMPVMDKTVAESYNVNAKLQAQRVKTQLETNLDRISAAEPGKPIPQPKTLDPEVAYITDTNGTFVSVEDHVWNDFITNNTDLDRAPWVARCMYPSILGRSLFEFIGDLKIQSFYRHIMLLVAAGTQRRYHYYYYCDSPDYERKVLMTICRIKGSGNNAHILWLSKVIDETLNEPRASYLACKPVQTASEIEKQTTITRTCCSYCKRILVSAVEINNFTNMLDDLARRAVMGQLITPIMEDNGQVPVFGGRGKQGQQYFETLDQLPQHLWLTPEEYYRYFPQKSMLDALETFTTFSDISPCSPDNILLNHGICELCYREIATAFFPAWLNELGG